MSIPRYDLYVKKKRFFDAEQIAALVEEVNKLLKAGFIRVVE